MLATANNMAHSLMYACAKVGMNMVLRISEKATSPDPENCKKLRRKIAALTGCTIEVDEDLFPCRQRRRRSLH